MKLDVIFQVKITRELDGLVATLPSATRNMFVDGVSFNDHISHFPDQVYIQG